MKHPVAAERQYGGTFGSGAKTGAIALERPEVRKQPVRCRNGYRSLQVRVRRHERCLQAVSLIDHHLLQ